MQQSMHDITAFITSKTMVSPREAFVASTRVQALEAFTRSQSPSEQLFKLPAWLKISVPIASAFAALLMLTSSLQAPEKQYTQLSAIESDVTAFEDELQQDAEFESFLIALESGDINQLEYTITPTENSK